MSNQADEVRGALKNWLAAFNSKDKESFFNLYDPDIVYANCCHPNHDGCRTDSPLV